MTRGYNIFTHHLCCRDLRNVYSGKNSFNVGKDGESPLTFQKKNLNLTK